LQNEKQNDPIISAFRGISIHSSDENENAFDSIRFNREFDSNEIEESHSHLCKQDDPSIATFRGISIDSSDEDENADDLIRINPEHNSNQNN
jgi:hypothetical protein